MVTKDFLIADNECYVRINNSFRNQIQIMNGDLLVKSINFRLWLTHVILIFPFMVFHNFKFTLSKKNSWRMPRYKCSRYVLLHPFKLCATITTTRGISSTTDFTKQNTAQYHTEVRNLSFLIITLLLICTRYLNTVNPNGVLHCPINGKFYIELILVFSYF